MTPGPGERDLLEQVAKRYDSRTDFDRYFSEYGADLILETFRGRRLLEVGVSGGVMTRRFRGRVPELHALDGSARYIESVRSELGDQGITYHVSLAEDFKPPHEFDGVVVASLLEHVEDPVGILQKARGWLGPGGELYAIVPNANSLHRQVGVLMGMLPDVKAFSDRDRMLGHRRVYDVATLTGHLRAAGFQVAECRGIMLKVVSNAQMESWDDPLVRALLRLGAGYPDIAAQIFARCTLPGPANG
jgi:2-polyprenyl-3-methyl-5-hydroxy-6-metoxy-1,4-benzoquinol methylase